MKIEGATVTFKSVDPFYTLERDGDKPNTIRLVTLPELMALRNVTHVQILLPSKSGEALAAESFTRPISGIFDITEGMAMSHIEIPDGQFMVSVCWDAE